MARNPMVNPLIGFSAAVITLAIVYFFYRPSMHRVDTLTIRGHEFVVERAVTPAQRYQGLSGREPLADKMGMLFVFGLPIRPQFVMRGMKFALDFIWIDSEKVIDLTKNVPAPMVPDDERQVYEPKEKVQYVLEVIAGTIDRYGIKVGDKVEGLTK